MSERESDCKDSEGMERRGLPGMKGPTKEEEEELVGEEGVGDI